MGPGGVLPVLEGMELDRGEAQLGSDRVLVKALLLEVFVFSPEHSVLLAGLRDPGVHGAAVYIGERRGLAMSALAAVLSSLLSCMLTGEKTGCIRSLTLLGIGSKKRFV